MTEKNILTVEEVIDYTGYSTRYLYNLTASRQIPHFKPNGRKIFFKKDEIDEWIEKGRVKTLDELGDEAI